MAGGVTRLCIDGFTQERIDVRRQGTVWLGSAATSGTATVVRGDGVLSVMPGDLITGYYLDRDAGGGSRLIEVTVPTRAPYTVPSDFSMTSPR